MSGGQRTGVRDTWIAEPNPYTAASFEAMYCMQRISTGRNFNFTMSVGLETNQEEELISLES